MKNKDGDSIITGKLVSDNLVTIEIDILSGSEDCQDNIEALGDLGYEDDVNRCVELKENIQLSIADFNFMVNDIEILTSETYRLEKFDTYDNNTYSEEKESLKILIEFFGPIIDARETT